MHNEGFQKMKKLEKHKDYISKKLIKSYQIESITKVKKLPKEIKYITWSIGWESETDYTYEINCKNQNGETVKVFCEIVTFLSFFIIQALFFEERENKYFRIYP